MAVQFNLRQVFAILTGASIYCALACLFHVFFSDVRLNLLFTATIFLLFTTAFVPTQRTRSIWLPLMAAAATSYGIYESLIPATFAIRIDKFVIYLFAILFLLLRVAKLEGARRRKAQILGANGVQ